MGSHKTKQFVLNSEPYDTHPGQYWDGYYTGHIYSMRREKYATADTDISKAKRYKSEKTAERACEALNNKVVNYVFHVEEYIEDCFDKECEPPFGGKDACEFFQDGKCTANV